MRRTASFNRFTRRMLGGTIGATIGATFLTLSAAALASVGAQELGISVGATAPGAPLETLEGKPIDLKEFIGKQPVVLEFWATWCGNCKQLEPQVAKVTKKYAGQITFIIVAVSVNQPLERVKAWQKLHPLPMEILYDRKGDASEAYEAPATSYVVVINKAGKVAYTGVGGTQDLDAAIRKGM